MTRFIMDPEEFMTIPIGVNLVSKEAQERYEALVAEAKERMAKSGMQSLLDKQVQKRPPKLCRRIP